MSNLFNAMENDLSRTPETRDSNGDDTGMPVHISPEPEKKIKGWLSFFLIVYVGVGVLSTLLLNIFSFSIANYDTGYGRGMAVFGLISDIILIGGIVLIGCYTIYSFYKFKPDSVGLARTYIAIVMGLRILTLLAGGYTDSGIGSLRNTIVAILAGIAWLLYFNFSEQVNLLYPKENRRFGKRDKTLVFVVVTPSIVWLLCIILMGMGY